MDAGAIGALIPIFALSIPIVAIIARHRTKVMQMQIEAAANQTAEKAAQYASHTQQLEERVRVLERIVTDKGYDVGTQIDALRDAREIDRQIAALKDEGTKP
ncbi:MAG: hypothetical protein KGL48_01430 [Sphingomonadales bacterium]|nr:hypothetical protein [Sphingomonadales bacterium]MDE2570368.1 hypothetical protein [Sphingomonadales bacterium]